MTTYKVDYLRLNVSLSQDGCPLERYVENFLELSHQVSWDDCSFNACLLMGLGDGSLRCLAPEFRERPVGECIDFIWRIYLRSERDHPG